MIGIPRVPIFAGTPPDFALMLIIHNIVSTSYVNPKIDSEKLIYGAIRGYFSALNDPYSKFLTPSEYAQFRTKTSAQSGAKLTVKTLSNNIGYINIPNFDSRAIVPEIVQAILQLKSQNISGMLIDLRNNSGGQVSVAVEVASLWVKGGTIVESVNRTGHREKFETTRPSIYTGPLVVLVNQSTASAAEIFAGSIKDHHRGIIVGQRTFGKALIQQTTPLYDGSAVMVTVERYWTPAGLDISNRGIIPDVIVGTNSRHVRPDPSYINDRILQTGMQTLLQKISPKK